MNGRYLTLAGRIRRDLKDLETVHCHSKSSANYSTVVAKSQTGI